MMNKNKPEIRFPGDSLKNGNSVSWEMKYMMLEPVEVHLFLELKKSSDNPYVSARFYHFGNFL